jgi:hypothetical protein
LTVSIAANSLGSAANQRARRGKSSVHRSNEPVFRRFEEFNYPLAGHRLPACALAQLSRSPIVRLKTSRPGRESGSRQK